MSLLSTLGIILQQLQEVQVRFCALVSSHCRSINCHQLLAAAGDQANNLMWRLQHGEVFYKHPPKVAVVLIGTNDLSAIGCSTGESGLTSGASGLVAR